MADDWFSMGADMMEYSSDAGDAYDFYNTGADMTSTYSDAAMLSDDWGSFMDEESGAIGDVLSLLKTDLGQDLTNAAFGAFGGGGSGGGGGTGKAGGSGFVENPILTSARGQAMRDISQRTSQLERSQRADSPGARSNPHSRAIMDRLRQNRSRSFDSLYSRIHSYASKSTSRVSPKARA